MRVCGTAVDGHVPVRPGQSLWPFDCVLRIGREARSRGNEGNGWRWAHCWASCRIRRACGGTTVAKTAGFGKEVLDGIRCGFEVVRGGLGFGNHCDSTFQPTDFDDNQTGITCPDQITCDQRCEDLVGQTADPGPFFGIGIPIRISLGIPF